MQNSVIEGNLGISQPLQNVKMILRIGSAINASWKNASVTQNRVA